MKLFTLFLLSIALASNILIANNRNFDDIVTKQKDKLTFVKFYATWCSHCKTMVPIYEKLADHYASDPDVQIVQIECESNRAVCSQMKIRGFPTLRLYKQDHEKDFSGKRNLENFIRFIDENNDANTHNPQIESNVAEVTQFDFDKVLNQGKDLVLVVTAAWSDYSSKLKPQWEKLSDAFANEKDKVIIGELSITSHPAEDFVKKYHITSLPAIISFKDKNPTVIEYNGSFDLVSLVEHVNKLSNTHRTVDGSLNTKAGLIPEIDTLLSTVEDDSSLHDIVTRLDQVKSTSSKYYKKLLNKLLNGESKFIASEAARIAKLKSNVKDLSSEVLDDLQVRLNILSSFKDITITPDFTTSKNGLIDDGSSIQWVTFSQPDDLTGSKVDNDIGTELVTTNVVDELNKHTIWRVIPKITVMASVSKSEIHFLLHDWGSDTASLISGLVGTQEDVRVGIGWFDLVALDLSWRRQCFFSGLYKGWDQFAKH
ncbi:hypothetical protein WICPIJ_008959 [Wickerhamomyces pijperi]|uniref:protein disulfide-isomerase n=1 Tax=Wickerhamomyces pijperi TaxID=599730 RepID=A0A9P8PUL9_WICPI|nr:hypothetical protein WICPIJ_008959 [Wickerhamomyces pijperi]